MQNLSLFESNSQPLTVDNHLSLNLNDYADLNAVTFSSLTETKSYTPITGCVLEHILTTTNLTNREKLYYLLADSLALISKNKGGSRSIALPSEDWAELLNCSRSLVFVMQQNLVDKGYFIIQKDFDKIGRNNRNLITPTLPAGVFNHLNEKYPDRLGEHTSYNPLVECKRAYLDRTKLFIKLSYNLLKVITSNEYINPMQKMLWLGFYTRGYKNHMLQSREDFNRAKYSYNGDGYNSGSGSSFSFIASYRELADQYSCDAKYLSKSIRALEELGFIKTQNIYIRKKGCENDNASAYTVQERQDKSLWKITLSLPKACILELEKVKDRSNLKLKAIKDKLAVIENTVDPKLIEVKLIEDCLILGGIKFTLNLEQSDVLKSLIESNSNDNGDEVDCSTDNREVIPLLPHAAACAESYIDSVMAELDALSGSNRSDTQNRVGVEITSEESAGLEYIDFPSDVLKTLPASSSIELSNIVEALDDINAKSTGIKSDPHVAKSGLLYNKNLISKIIDIKSNLGAMPKVLFNDFLMIFNKDELDENSGNKAKEMGKKNENRELNIHSELIRKNLKELSRDKADKARKFAYSLVSKGLAKGYAASLSKHELAKQIIHHAASWKPTKLGSISREKEIDTALSVAWKAVVGGTWQLPLELAKAEVLQYEFNAYRSKYQRSGVISNDLISLQSIVKTLIGSSYISLEKEIKKYSVHNSNLDNDSHEDRLNSDLNSGLNNNLALIGMQNSYYNDQSSYVSNGSSLSNVNNENGYDNYLPQARNAHNNDIELPSYHEEQEYHLSYSCRDDGAKALGTKDYYEGLTSETEHKDEDTDIICKDEDIPNDSINQMTNRIFDLSNISEKQKYLRMTTLENGNEMIIKTIGDTEYFYKLKSMEFNDEGDTIMTLKNVKLGLFIEEASNEIFAKTIENVESNEICSLDDKSNYLAPAAYNVQNQQPTTQ